MLAKIDKVLRRARKALVAILRAALSLICRLRQIPPRFFLALAAVAIGAIAIIVAAHCRPASLATLSTHSPTPGVPVALLDVGASSGDPTAAAAPLEADLGALEISPLEPSHSLRSAGFALSIPLAEPDCRQLVDRLGGSCGEAPLPPSPKVDGLDLEDIDPNRSLSVSIYPGATDRIELGATSLPSAWTLRSGGTLTEIELRCPRPTAIHLVALPVHRRLSCAPRQATYRLLLTPSSHYPTTVFLNQLTRIDAELHARQARASLQQGNLVLGGTGSERLDRPAAVMLRAASHHWLHLGLNDTSGNRRLWVSGQVGSATVDGRQHLGTWLDDNSTVFYAALALFFTLMVTPIYLLGRRG